MRSTKAAPTATANGKDRPAPLDAILVPLDGSELAERAIPVAVALARRARATLHFVAVPPPVPSVVLAAEDPTTSERVARETRRQLRKYLIETAAAISTKHDLPVTWALGEGAPAAALAAYARAHAIDLVLMTTHGRGGLSRLWLGSVADQLLRRVTAPVLLLRSGQESPPADFRQIMVALDGSGEAEAVLEPAIALGSLSAAAQYTLVLVIEPPVPLAFMAAQPVYVAPDWPEPQRQLAAEYLERVAKRLRARGLAVTTSALVGAGVAGQITDLARERGSTLIALTTHGASGLERLMLGSVADKVVRGAAQPVLVVPLRAAAARPSARKRRRAPAARLAKRR